MFAGRDRVAKVKGGRGVAPFLALAALSLTACDTGYVPPPRLKDRPMPDLPDVQLKLASTCAYRKVYAGAEAAALGQTV